ncbi:MAG: MFS transporter [Firmicutes bacterium]|nr:MFS transporter [Bacillota bacterium]
MWGRCPSATACPSAFTARLRGVTRWGRRRPWFLFGAVPLGLSFFLLFLVPPLSSTSAFWYYLIVSLVFDTAFTVVNVPYTALTPELSRDYDERTSLNSYRFAFSVVSGLLAAVTFKPIADAFGARGGPRFGYTAAALVWAVLSTLPFFFAFLFTYERHEPGKREELPFLDGAFANRAFRYVTAIYLVSWLVVQVVSTVFIYYVTYWLRRPGLVAPAILCIQSSTLLWLIVWTAVSRRAGKKSVYFRGIGFWIAVSIALFFVQPDWPTWSALVLGALAGVGVASAYLVPWAMLPDVIELDELTTGRRREGIFYGFFVLLQKAGLALGLFLVGLTLDWAGYIKPAPGAIEPVIQPDSALLAIRLFMGPLPAVILALGIWLVHRFPITRESHQRTLRELAARTAVNAIGTSKPSA